MSLNRPKTTADVQREIDKAYLAQLPAISLVVFVYYGFVTLAHFYVLPPETLPAIAGTSAAAALMAGVLFVLTKKDKVSVVKSHLAFLPTILLVLLTVFVHIFLSQDQMQLTNAILALYALGFVILSPMIYSVLLGLTVGGFIVALLNIEGEFTAHLAFMLAAALALSILGFFVRYRTLHISSRMLIANRGRTRRLVAASHEIKAKMHEVERAGAARDVFLANISHELRTPLTGVTGMLELIEDTRLNDDQKALVATAQKSADYLMNIVNDLLDFAKLEAGKVSLTNADIDLKKVTFDVVQTLKVQAEAKGISLEFTPPGPGIYRVKADEARISQILLNLVNNAVKFTSRGGVHVGLEEGPFGECIWTVADTGRGIPEEQLSKLFERFMQVDASRTRRLPGTGLGLSIVHELVKLLGGKIEVKSELEKGSSFTVTLPLERLDPEQPSGLDEPEKSPNKDGLSLRHLKLKALAAEDNEINRFLLKKIMEKLGVEVVFVEDGVDAIEAVKKASQPFDFILMDVQMPVMDGVTATRILREQYKCTVPILAVTANTMEQDFKQYLDAGMDGCIGKPINMDEFYTKVLECISWDDDGTNAENRVF